MQRHNSRSDKKEAHKLRSFCSNLAKLQHGAKQAKLASRSKRKANLQEERKNGCAKQIKLASRDAAKEQSWMANLQAKTPQRSKLEGKLARKDATKEQNGRDAN